LNESIASQIIGRLTASATADGASPVELLADRELQVFELTGQGLNTRQIALRLHLGVKTVETYRHRIREKLRLDHPTDLLQAAITWTHRASK